LAIWLLLYNGNFDHRAGHSRWGLQWV